MISSTVSVYGDYFDKVNQKYESSLWKLGENIQEGDTYEYKICSDSNYDRIISQIIHPNHCYTISLEFVTILESYKGMVWVVQGNFTIPSTILGTTPEISNQMILLINPDTFQVSTDKLNVNLGSSLENTIFSLSIHGKKSLSTGTIWGMIPSYFTNDIPLEIKRHQIIDTPIGEIDSIVLGYDIIEESNYYISKNIPFPVRAEILSPHIIFP